MKLDENISCYHCRIWTMEKSNHYLRNPLHPQKLCVWFGFTTMFKSQKTLIRQSTQIIACRCFKSTWNLNWLIKVFYHCYLDIILIGPFRKNYWFLDVVVFHGLRDHQILTLWITNSGIHWRPDFSVTIK